MKYRLFYIFCLAISFSSCISSKRYSALESRLFEKERENKTLQTDYSALFMQNSILKDSLLVLKFENTLERQKIVVLNKELVRNNQTISDLESRLDEKEKSIVDLTNKNDILINTNKSYSDIAKGLIENLENQSLKVLNLSLALQKQDSLNVNRVKKTNREISEHKYKKALEKLGFVFN